MLRAFGGVGAPLANSRLWKRTCEPVTVLLELLKRADRVSWGCKAGECSPSRDQRHAAFKFYVRQNANIQSYRPMSYLPL